MVSSAAIVGMVLSLALFIGFVIVVYIRFWSRSKVVETGFLGAFGLGASGYFWSMIMLMVGGFALVDWLILEVKMPEALRLAFVPFLATVFATLGCWWANGLTNNRKNISLYRGMAVGLGFGAMEGFFYFVTKTIIDIRHAFEINQGTYFEIMRRSSREAADIQKYYDGLVELNPVIPIVDAIDRIMVTLIYIALVVIMTKYMKEKRMGMGVGAFAGLFFLYFSGVTIIENVAAGILGQVVLYAFVAVVTVACLHLARKAYATASKLQTNEQSQ